MFNGQVVSVPALSEMFSVHNEVYILEYYSIYWSRRE